MMALIPVRGGSERVPNKNIRPFAGSNLLELKITQLKRIFDDVVVSTDSPEMMTIAENYGCIVQHRDPHYCKSSTSMSEVYSYMACEFPDSDIAYCNATSPLVTDDTIRKCLETYDRYQGEPLISVNTVTPVKEFLWRDGAPINYTPADQPRSQDLPYIVRITFACSVLARETMITLGNVVSPTPYFVYTDAVEASDIDTDYDFRVAETLWRQLCK